MSISTDYGYYSSTYCTQQTSKKEKDRLSLMSLIDSNEDKTLGAEELSDFVTDYNEKTGGSLDLSSIMAKYDANGDDELNESEQEAMNNEKALEKLLASGMQNRHMRKMDGPPRSFLSDIDKDGDGSWNSDELSQFINTINEATGSSFDLESVLQRYDSDGDGMLSQSEQVEMQKGMMPPPPKSSDASTNDETARVQMDELRKFFEERFAKKQEENITTENDVAKNEDIKLAFQRRLSQSIRTYEKSFLFENAKDEAAQYGA